jgi:hypothetical protein
MHCHIAVHSISICIGVCTQLSEIDARTEVAKQSRSHIRVGQLLVRDATRDNDIQSL